MRTRLALIRTLAIGLLCPACGIAKESVRDDFDVVIAGGTTAALAAAVAAHDEGVRVALLEPTDWPGGQLTATGVPAVDESYRWLAARDPRNMSPLFRDMLARSGVGGSGWVSRYCFEPVGFLAKEIEPLLGARAERLVVFPNTVVKRVEREVAGARLTGLMAVQRTPRSGVKWKGYDRLPSQDLVDWYAPQPSERFDKKTLWFRAREGAPIVFLDATDWGEVLAISDAPYLQGCENVDGELPGNDRCGQATVFGFVEQLTAEPVDEPPPNLNVGNLGFGQYAGRPKAWELIWTYRRIRGRDPEPTPGDLSLQNWGYSDSRREGGNDYPFAYLFVSKQDAEAQAADWNGGVDMEVLAAAEQRALAWHQWFKQHAPQGIKPEQVSLAIGALGTGHGLAKLPYIRDTRRSIGVDGFLLKYNDIAGPPAQRSGTVFPDRVAIGSYEADIHSLVNCQYPAYIKSHAAPLPYYIPFRALTNERYGNLLVAGKTMAQTFLVNSATRLHPIEWSSGTAAGVAAAEMARSRLTSRQLLDHIGDLQNKIKPRTPIDWSLDP